MKTFKHFYYRSYYSYNHIQQTHNTRSPTTIHTYNIPLYSLHQSNNRTYAQHTPFPIQTHSCLLLLFIPTMIHSLIRFEPPSFLLFGNLLLVFFKASPQFAQFYHHDDALAPYHVCVLVTTKTYHFASFLVLGIGKSRGILVVS